MALLADSDGAQVFVDFRPSMIISGAQTGADRGGLIAAAILGYRHGGYCPKGRKAEDGKIPECYPVEECDSADYRVRTRLNAEFADATIVFSYEDVPTGGTALTIKLLRELKKPGLHFVLERDASLDQQKAAAKAIRKWMREKRPRVLNVAGPRESKALGVKDQVAEVMLLTLQTPNKCICGRVIPEGVWSQALKGAPLPVRCSQCEHASYWSDFE
jgi:hypothetical protein